MGYVVQQFRNLRYANYSGGIWQFPYGIYAVEACFD